MTLQPTTSTSSPSLLRMLTSRFQRPQIWCFGDTPLSDEINTIVRTLFPRLSRFPRPRPLRVGNIPPSSRRTTAPDRFQRAMAFLEPALPKNSWRGDMVSYQVMAYLDCEAITAAYAVHIAGWQVRRLMIPVFALCAVASIGMFAALKTMRFTDSQLLASSILLVLAATAMVLYTIETASQRALLRAMAAWAGADPAAARQPARLLVHVTLAHLFARDNTPGIFRGRYTAQFPSEVINVIKRLPPDVQRHILHQVNEELEREPDPETIRALPAYQRLMNSTASTG